MGKTAFAVLMGLFVIAIGAAHAADNKDKSEIIESRQDHSFPRVSLEGILDAVSKKSGKTFLVDSRVSPAVVVGQPRARDVTFPMLLKILRNNGLAAVSEDDTVSIVPVATVRQYPLPLLIEDDDTIDPEAWVTRVVGLNNASAKQMVPILRPLLPQPGHLTAHVDSNTLTIVDRYANVRRIVQMVLVMDASAQKLQDQ